MTYAALRNRVPSLHWPHMRQWHSRNATSCFLDSISGPTPFSGNADRKSRIIRPTPRFSHRFGPASAGNIRTSELANAPTIKRCITQSPLTGSVAIYRMRNAAARPIPRQNADSVLGAVQDVGYRNFVTRFRRDLRDLMFTSRQSAAQICREFSSCSVCHCKPDTDTAFIHLAAEMGHRRPADNPYNRVVDLDCEATGPEAWDYLRLSHRRLVGFGCHCISPLGNSVFARRACPAGGTPDGADPSPQPTGTVRGHNSIRRTG